MKLSAVKSYNIFFFTIANGTRNLLNKQQIVERKANTNERSSTNANFVICNFVKNSSLSVFDKISNQTF